MSKLMVWMQVLARSLRQIQTKFSIELQQPEGKCLPSYKSSDCYFCLILFWEVKSKISECMTAKKTNKTTPHKLAKCYLGLEWFAWVYCPMMLVYGHKYHSLLCCRNAACFIQGCKLQLISVWTKEAESFVETGL